jgi:bidirectional [NiFe] hydrogenase diaphorase subunit
MVDATMRKHGHRPDALIETLHTVQETFGCLDKEALRYVAGSLRVPLSRVYGVATFYHFFSLTPKGEHTCIVCMGTACYIKGAPKILDVVRDTFKIQAGETTPDGKLSLIAARCIGACGGAPAVVFDHAMVSNVTPEDAVNRVKGWMTDAD